MRVRARTGMSEGVQHGVFKGSMSGCLSAPRLSRLSDDSERHPTAAILTGCSANGDTIALSLSWNKNKHFSHVNNKKRKKFRGKKPTMLHFLIEILRDRGSSSSSALLRAACYCWEASFVS